MIDIVILWNNNGRRPFFVLALKEIKNFLLNLKSFLQIEEKKSQEEDFDLNSSKKIASLAFYTSFKQFSNFIGSTISQYSTKKIQKTLLEIFHESLDREFGWEVRKVCLFKFDGYFFL